MSKNRFLPEKETEPEGACDSRRKQRLSVVIRDLVVEHLRSSIQFGDPCYEMRQIVERLEYVEQWGSEKQGERIGKFEEAVAELKKKINFEDHEGLAEWILEKVRSEVGAIQQIDALEARIEALENRLADEQTKRLAKEDLTP